MPELPEVETIRLGLEAELIGMEITDVAAPWPGSVRDPVHGKLTGELAKRYFKSFRRRLIGLHVEHFGRRGKVLLVYLSNGLVLLIHLKMTGQLVFVQQAAPRKGKRGKEKGETARFAGGHPTKSMVGKLPDSSTRVIFSFNNRTKLFFNDQRKFGWIKLVPPEAVEQDSLLLKMGVEPLSREFTQAALMAKITGRKMPIKAVLLDQTTLAGLGNIYVDEALHLAKIHPLRTGSSLSVAELKRLHLAIATVLEASLDYGGTSFTNYVNSLGVKGNYLDNARVFKRQGQPCPECGKTIEKIRIAGRGTHICPKCQKV